MVYQIEELLALSDMYALAIIGTLEIIMRSVRLHGVENRRLDFRNVAINSASTTTDASMESCVKI